MMLSTKQCCTDNDCLSGVGSKKELQGKSPVRENECPGCSPFFTCGSCVGFIVCKPLTIDFPVAAEKPTAYHTSYQQPYIEKITLSIWLPPKIS